MMTRESAAVTGGDILALALRPVDVGNLTSSARSGLRLDSEGIRVDVDCAADEDGHSLERKTCFHVSRDPDGIQPDLVYPDFASSLVSYAAVKYHIGLKTGRNVSCRDLPSFIRYVDPEKVTGTTGLYCRLESDGVGIGLVCREEPRKAREEDRLVCYARTCSGHALSPAPHADWEETDVCLRSEWEQDRLLALYLAASYGFPLEIVDNRRITGQQRSGPGPDARGRIQSRDPSGASPPGASDRLSVYLHNISYVN